MKALHQGSEHEALYCLDASGSDVVAGGAPALVLASADSGKTWTQVAQGVTDKALLGCSLKNGVGLIVGQNGIVLRREKGQADWVAIESGAEDRLFAVDSNANGLTVAVGAFGAIMRSTDAGKTWAHQAVDWSQFNADGLDIHLYGVVVGEDNVVTIAGEFETILRSTDGGVTWASVHQGEASLFDLTIGADGVGYAVGQKGTVLRTGDSGVTWSSQKNVTDANLLGVRVRADGAVLVTGIRTMLEGKRDADDWKVVLPGDVATNWYEGLALVNNADWLAVGHRGRIVQVEP